MPFTRPFLLAAALLAATVSLRAQTKPDSSGFGALESQIRASTVPDDLYYRQLEDAWDRAVVGRQYGRADSVAVLVERLIAEKTGLVRDSLVWPEVGDRLAVSLLRGDVAEVEAFAGQGSEWRTPRRSSLPNNGVFAAGPWLRFAPTSWLTLRRATANVLAQDSSLVAERLAANGADQEVVAVARLAVQKLLLQPRWTPGFRAPDVSDAQIALNERADAFLARYRGERFSRFVREAVRVRYRVDGAVSFYFGFGSGWGTGALGEATGYSVAGELGLGLRYRWAHADIGFHGSDLRVSETRPAGGETLEEGDRLTFALIGVGVGPRLSLGGLDVLPYVAGGLLVQNVSGESENEPERSTYEPPNRLGWGYGVALEYLGGRSSRYGGTAVRLRAGRVLPQLSDGLGLDGPVTAISLGVTLTGLVRTRVD